MDIRIRPADLDSDSEALLCLLGRHIWAGSNSARFQWLYRNGVCGSARVWVAVEKNSERIVGSAAAYPRRLRFGRRESLGFVFGDFCMDEKYRSLGPSLQLQRACLTVLQEPPFEFIYDFPSRSMMAIYKRLGIEQSGELARWAKPLRAEQKLLSAVRSKTLARGLSFVANPILASRGWKGDKNCCELVLQEEPCGTEFSMFDEEISAGSGIRTSRNAEYLNWRYLAAPGAGYELLAARRSGKLLGYVLSTPVADDARIVDLCSIDEPGVTARLLYGAVERLRALGAATVSLNAGGAHPWNYLFERAGFRRRQSSPIVVAVAQSSPISRSEFERNWFVMQGERDS